MNHVVLPLGNIEGKDLTLCNVVKEGCLSGKNMDHWPPVRANAQKESTICWCLGLVSVSWDLSTPASVRLLLLPLVVMWPIYDDFFRCVRVLHVTCIKYTVQ